MYKVGKSGLRRGRYEAEAGLQEVTPVTLEPRSLGSWRVPPAVKVSLALSSLCQIWMSKRIKACFSSELTRKLVGRAKVANYFTLRRKQPFGSQEKHPEGCWSSCQ